MKKVSPSRRFILSVIAAALTIAVISTQPALSWDPPQITCQNACCYGIVYGVCMPTYSDCTSSAFDICSDVYPNHDPISDFLFSVCLSQIYVQCDSQLSACASGAERECGGLDTQN